MTLKPNGCPRLGIQTPVDIKISKIDRVVPEKNDVKNPYFEAFFAKNPIFSPVG